MRRRARLAVLLSALLPAVGVAYATAAADDGVTDAALTARRHFGSLALTARAPQRATRSSTVAAPDTSHPLDGLGPNDLDRLLREDPSKLGCASIGAPNRGALFNGVQLQTTDYVEAVSPANAWGTSAGIAAIDRAARAVRAELPGGPTLFVGDISAEHGGYLKPHRSHQSGLDADLGYFYVDESAWYAPATKDNLDRPRTWALVKALIAEGEVEYLFIDRTVQGWLREHAEKAGDDPAWLAQVFASESNPEAMVRHTWGHRSHLHVRFADPIARETGRRLHPLLVRSGRLWR